MTCNRTNLTGANLHWAELEKMYETFVRTVELAGKQLISSRMVLIKKKTSLFTQNNHIDLPFKSRRHKTSFFRSCVLFKEN